MFRKNTKTKDNKVQKAQVDTTHSLTPAKDFRSTYNIIECDDSGATFMNLNARTRCYMFGGGGIGDLRGIEDDHATQIRSWQVDRLKRERRDLANREASFAEVDESSLHGEGRLND